MLPDILVMFSGGLDSTGMLWKLINNKQKIHVHHMNLFNVENRAIAESHAVKKIIKYFKQHAEFGYSESEHHYPRYDNKFIWDSDIVAFISGSMCLSMPYLKHVALGMTKTDISGNNSLRERIVRATKILEAFTPATKIYPVAEMSKAEIYKMLPAELRDLTWSCRTPIYQNSQAIPCNKCPTCLDLNKIKAEQ